MNQMIANPMGPSAIQGLESSGARQSQSRELAEAQVKYLMAQQFPRNVVAVVDRILNAFTRSGLAEKSQYQFARSGSDIVGPSIRAAEAIAQQWGNMEQGWRELSRGIGSDGVPFSEVEAYCCDLESRSFKRLQFLVKHWRDTKSGGYKIKEERDIYELVANQSQRRVRACILAMIPADVIDTAMEQAELTLRTTADTSPAAMAKMVETFEGFGVRREHIEKVIQRRLDAIAPAQVMRLKRIYASLRDGMSSPADWFDIDDGDAISAAKQGQSGSQFTQTYSQADFERNLPTWTKAIQSGKATADDVIEKVSTKGVLTSDQITAIRAISSNPPVAIEQISRYEKFAAGLNLCTDQDTALAIVDEAREYLTPGEQNDLFAVYKTKFGA